ncbi:MAG: hypothetical protein ACI837_003231 [Crocinitomicaceae bacterium]|jgi:hypothetical protein
MSKDNAVLMEPQFTDLDLLPNDLILVNLDGEFGVMNCALEYIQPPVYDGLEWISKYYYHSAVNDQYFWKFKSTNGYGILNRQFDTIIPPIYDDIKLTYMRDFKEDEMYHGYKNVYPTSGDSISFFEVSTSLKKGIIREDGKMIVPPEFEHIKFKFSINGPTKELPHGRYFVANDSVSVRLFSSDGIQLLKDQESTTIYASAVGTLESKEPFTVAWLGNGALNTSKLANISTNVVREEFRDNTIWKGNLIISTDQSGKSEVLNGNLEVVYRADYGVIQMDFLLPDENSLYLISTGHSQTCVIDENGELILPLATASTYYTNDDDTPLIWRLKYDAHRQFNSLELYTSNGQFIKKYASDRIYYQSFFKNEFDMFPGDKIEELLFLSKDKKWGALDHKGNLVLPFSYDSHGVRYSKKHDTIQGYYIRENDKMGVVDYKGRIIESCIYQDLQMNFAGDLYLYKRNNLYGLKDLDGKVYVNKCDTLFFSDISKLYSRYVWQLGEEDLELIGSKKNHPFAIIKGKLHTLHNGKFEICDSTILNFSEPLLHVEGTLIDKTGEVILSSKDGKLKKSKHFYLLINDSIAEVISFQGSKSLRIENFKAAQREGNYLKIKLTNDHIGILRLDGSGWLFPPTYYDITLGTDFPNKTWVKTTPIEFTTHRKEKTFKSFAGGWKLIDTHGKDMFDFEFKYVPFLYDHSRAYFESNDRMGIIDSNFNLIFSPVHEFILPTTNEELFIIYEEGKWTFKHSSGVQLSEEYSSCSLEDFNGCCGVFQFTETDTLIGIVSFLTDFEWIIPLTEIHEAAQLYSFEKELKIGNYAGLPSKMLAIYPDQPDAWKVQNNEMIINVYLKEQAQWQLTVPGDGGYSVDFEWQTRHPNEQDPSFFEDVSTLSNPTAEYIQFRYPAELHQSQVIDNRPWILKLNYTNNAVLSRTVQPRRPYSYYAKKHENFIFIDRAIKVNLWDLFIDTSKAQEFIYTFIKDELNKNQSLLEQCPDINKLAESAEVDFVFTKGGLQLTPTFNHGFFLPYADLSPYLRPEVRDLGEW